MALLYILGSISLSYSPTLCGSSRASQSRESLAHEVGKRISWWKKWACWRYSFYSGARIKTGIPPRSRRHSLPPPASNPGRHLIRLGWARGQLWAAVTRLPRGLRQEYGTKRTRPGRPRGPEALAGPEFPAGLKVGGLGGPKPQLPPSAGGRTATSITLPRAS